MSWILGIGTDLVDSRRVERVMNHHEKRFLDRVFTPHEQRYCLQQKVPSLALAKRFAAKEAFAKALGWGIGSRLSWLDIGVISGDRGEPLMTLSLAARQRIEHAVGIFHPHVSLSDESPYAIAFVMITGASLHDSQIHPTLPAE